MSFIKTHMEPYVLSEDQISFYNEEGYLHLKGVFPKRDIDVVRKDMDSFADGRYTIYLDMHHYKSLKQIHRGKKMCDIADALVGGQRAIPIGSTAFFCKTIMLAGQHQVLT